MADPNEGNSQVDEGTKDGVTQPVIDVSTIDEVLPEGETTEIVEAVDGEEPPGGTDGTAVYARKQHQEAKRLAKQLQVERERSIRLDERVRTLESTRVAPDVVYTPEQVQRGIDQGLVTASEGAAYLAKVTAEATYRKLDGEKQAREIAARPIAVAQQEVDQYLVAAPYLADDNDPRTQKVVDVYNQLRYKYNLPDNLVTKAMAVRESLGPVSNLQKRRTSDTLTRDGATFHTVRSGGGNLNEGALGDAALVAKAPAYFKEMWDKFHTTPAQRIAEIKLHNKRHPKK